MGREGTPQAAAVLQHTGSAAAAAGNQWRPLQAQTHPSRKLNSHSNLQQSSAQKLPSPKRTWFQDSSGSSLTELKDLAQRASVNSTERSNEERGGEGQQRDRTRASQLAACSSSPPKHVGKNTGRLSNVNALSSRQCCVCISFEKQGPPLPGAAKTPAAAPPDHPRSRQIRGPPPLPARRTTTASPPR
jgi:hypothetical protein